MTLITVATKLETALTFQTLLRQHRAEAGLSYHQLSERSTVDSAYLLALESGKKNNPSRDIVILIGSGLGLDVQSLDELVVSAGHLPLIKQRRLTQTERPAS